MLSAGGLSSREQDHTLSGGALGQVLHCTEFWQNLTSNLSFRLKGTAYICKRGNTQNYFCFLCQLESVLKEKNVHPRRVNSFRADTFSEGAWKQTGTCKSCLLL